MRISKPPEERKQEIIDTAMQIFAEKGYEATSVTDITKRMNVASGLFYKYFPSKENLYHIALEQYARQFSYHVIEALKYECNTMEDLYQMLDGMFFKHIPEQKYHSFFHERGNELFHQQLNYTVAMQVIPQATIFLEKLISRFQLRITDAKSTVQFFVFGIIPIMDDEDTTVDKKKVVMELVQKIVH